MDKAIEESDGRPAIKVDSGDGLGGPCRNRTWTDTVGGNDQVEDDKDMVEGW